MNNDELIKQYLQLALKLNEYTSYNSKQNDSSPSPYTTQSNILSLLKNYPKLRQVDLRHKLNITNQTISLALIKLESEGYIIRKTSNIDIRRKDIELTDKGWAITIQTDQKKMDVSQIFNVLNKDEKEEFSNYIIRLIYKLENKLKDV